MQTELHEIAANGLVHMLQLFLDDQRIHVSDLNAKDGCNRTPAYRAAYNGHKDCLKLLIKSGADWGYETGRGTVMDVIFAQITNPASFIREILDSGIQGKECRTCEENCKVTLGKYRQFTSCNCENCHGLHIPCIWIWIQAILTLLWPCANSYMSRWSTTRTNTKKLCFLGHWTHNIHAHPHQGHFEFYNHKVSGQRNFLNVDLLRKKWRNFYSVIEVVNFLLISELAHSWVNIDLSLNLRCFIFNCNCWEPRDTLTFSTHVP